MAWYVALVAMLNLGLGYALAVFLGTGRGRNALFSARTLEATESGELEG